MRGLMLQHRSPQLMIMKSQPKLNVSEKLLEIVREQKSAETG